MLDFSLYLITDRKQVAKGHTLFSAVESALKGGVRAVQLREKDLADKELLPLAEDLRKLTNSYSAKLLINDRVEVALSVKADGVHLGGHSLPVDTVRQQVGPEMLIGVSTHSEEEIQQAASHGADFVTFGPVFPTPSKAVYGPAQGVGALAEACANSTLPVFALGGITPLRAQECLQAGAKGVALISAIISSGNPGKAAQSFFA